MKNSVNFYSFFILFTLLIFSNKANASIAVTIPQIPFGGNVRDTIYMPSGEEIIAKKELISELKQLRIISNIAFLAIPLTIITFGLTFIAGTVLTIIAIVKLIKIQKKLNAFPWLRDDPELSQKIQNMYIRTGIHLGLYFILFLFIGLFILDSIFFLDTILELSSVIGVFSLILFFILDKLSFITKNYF
jgi:hypothetical protein